LRSHLTEAGGVAALFPVGAGRKLNHHAAEARGCWST